MLRSPEKKDIERKKHSPEEQYKLDREYSELLSAYTQKKREMKETEEKESKESEVTAIEASKAQDALYQFIIQNDYEISLHRITMIENRFKRILEVISAYFPDKKEESNNLRENEVYAYNSKKNVDRSFQRFIQETLKKDLLADLLKLIKPIFEEIVNAYKEIYSVGPWQEKNVIGNDELLPLTIALLQEVHKKYPHILPIKLNLDDVKNFIQLLESETFSASDEPISHLDSSHIWFYFQHLIQAWNKINAPSDVDNDNEESIDKLYLDLALLTQQETEPKVWPDELLTLTTKLPIENISSIINSQTSAFDHRNAYFVAYKAIIKSKTIEEAIYKIIALGQTIGRDQSNNNLEEFTAYLKKINFGALNLLKPENVIFTKGIAEAIEKEKALPHTTAKQKERFDALQRGFDFFKASAEQDEAFKNSSPPKTPLSTHAHVSQLSGNVDEKKQSRPTLANKKSSPEMTNQISRQTKNAEAFIKKDLSISSPRRTISNWYHRRTPFEKFLICSSLVLLTVAAIVAVAVTGVGAPLGAAIAAGAAKVATTSFGASAMVAATVGVTTKIAVVGISIGIAVGGATALGFEMDKILNPLTPGNRPAEIPLQKIAVNEDKYHGFDKSPQSQQYFEEHKALLNKSTLKDVNAKSPSSSKEDDTDPDNLLIKEDNENTQYKKN